MDSDAILNTQQALKNFMELKIISEILLFHFDNARSMQLNIQWFWMSPLIRERVEQASKVIQLIL